MSFVVTIDGPAASGKSSASRELAKRFGWKWVSTGAFYRGLALVSAKTGTDANDEDKVLGLVNSSEWNVVLELERTQVWFRGENVTDQIHSKEMGDLASIVSRHPRVRAAMLETQRRCALSTQGLIAEGRDCGTVVFPSANIKFFLTARDEMRAMRRALELGRSAEEILTAQKTRDQQDSNRTVAPMKIPEGSHIIDSSTLTLEQVVHELETKIRQVYQQD